MEDKKQEQNPVFSERWPCPICGNESVKIERIGSPSPINGSYIIDYVCEECEYKFTEGS